jgi:hypothetical protein
MTGLKILLDEVADEARLYPVVASAKARGRRRRRLRRVLAVGTASVAVLTLATGVYIGLNRDAGAGSVPVGASASPTATGLVLPASCTVTRLPTPDGYPLKAVVMGMDPTGRFILGRAYPGDGRPNMLVWDNGVVDAARMPGSEPQLVDVNSSGLAVGYTVYADDTFQAFVYRDGVLTKLADNASAWQVNEAGAILGQFGFGTTWQPVLWPSVSAQPIPLQLPADLPHALPAQLTDDGTVIGIVYRTDSPGGVFRATQPALWHADGTRVDLQWPAVDGPDSEPRSDYQLSEGRGDWVVLAAGGNPAAGSAQYVWNVRTGEIRPLAEAAELIGARAWSAAANSRLPDATLVSAEGSLTLPRLPEIDYGDPLETSVAVRGISEDGRTITGYLTRLQATFGYDDNLPLVWHCR